MLSMTCNEAIPLATMQEGMGWEEAGWVTFPEWLAHLGEHSQGRQRDDPHAPQPDLRLGDGWLRGRQGAPAVRRTSWNETARPAARGDGPLCCPATRTSGAVPVSTQPDWDGSPMITDLLTDEEIIFLGRELGKRGEGFIEMFDQAPHRPRHDRGPSWTASGRGERCPIVRNTFMRSTWRRPKQHRRFLDWLDAGHGLAVCGTTAWLFTVAGTDVPSRSTTGAWWDGAPEWQPGHERHAREARVAMMNNPAIRERLPQVEIDTGLVPGPGRLKLPGEPGSWYGTGGVRALRGSCWAAGSATWPRSGAAR